MHRYYLGTYGVDVCFVGDWSTACLSASLFCVGDIVIL